MKKLSVIIGLLSVWAMGFSQSLSLETFGTYFKAPNSKIEWEAGSNSIPSHIAIYETVANKFTPKQIAALVNFCGLSLTDKSFDNANVIGFDSADKSKHLGIYYPLGFIDFTAKEAHHDENNLVKEVPNANEARKRTLRLLGEIGIKPSDIEKNRTNSQPRLMSLGSEATYYVKPEPITNLYQREIEFKRSVDGMTVNGIDAGGIGSVVFGDRGRVTKLRIFWPNLKRAGNVKSPFSEQIINWIHQGKAVYGFRPMNEDPIDWNSVTKIKIYKEEIFLEAGMLDQRFKQLKPVISLWTTAIINGRSFDLDISCLFSEGEK